LQDYEFPLPPKDEQRRIADILWAAVEADDAMIEVCEAATLARNTAHRELFNVDIQDRSGRHEWKVKPIAEACEIANNLREQMLAFRGCRSM
jgi:type I restriction enzyme S subunit